jgi:ubiquinone/menaquinone biosynthesis C-methylase UbiE
LNNKSIYIDSGPSVSFNDTGTFENLYITLRKKENRIYTDDQLEKLPEIEPSHIHYKEWRVRKRSSNALVQYLSAKQKPLKVLEIGCGNGWLSHQLSVVAGSKITGSDINFHELQQAVRVFAPITNLQFIYGDIRTDVFENAQFDIIIFAASIQYFSSLTNILSAALQLLTATGEVHILDTHFYSAGSINDARKRTAEYYRQLDVPEMSAYYFHHTEEELNFFAPQKMNANKRGLFSFTQKDPFEWYCIQKQHPK